MPKEINIENNTHLKNNPFAVPNDYFMTNKEALENMLFTQADFNIPTDYFENNALFIKTLTKKAEQEDLYTTPDNYFETLSENISKRLEEMPNKQHQYKKIIFINTYVKWASIAAIITGIILLSWIYFFKEKNNIYEQPCLTIACLSKKDVIKNIDEFDASDIEDVIENTDTPPIKKQSADTLQNNLNETF